jgi:hypothetical protein
VGLQQIVEELHIELIVLHDQDGLAHPFCPSPAPAKSWWLARAPNRIQPSRDSLRKGK